MKKRTILDCQRDVKGIHDMEWICPSDDGSMYWCHKCGAIGLDTGRGGLERFKILKRVQE